MTVSKLIVLFAYRISYLAANRPSFKLTYQEQLPDTVKKLKEIRINPTQSEK